MCCFQWLLKQNKSDSIAIDLSLCVCVPHKLIIVICVGFIVLSEKKKVKLGIEAMTDTLLLML